MLCPLCNRVASRWVKGKCVKCYTSDYLKTYVRKNKQKKRPYKKFKEYRERTGWYKNYIREYNRKYILKNTDVYLAHKAVTNAIRNKTLTKKPCEVCKTDIRVHAHHEDYSKQLDVVWLCPTHHASRHREIKEAIKLRR